MSSINEDVVMYIENTPINKYLDAVEILLKLMDNIITNPGNQKYRTIRIENKIIKEKLLSVPGVKNILLSVGFEQTVSGAEYTLPSNVLIGKIKKYRDFLAERRTIKQGNYQSTSKLKEEGFNENTTTVKIKPRKIIPSKSYLEKISFPQVLSTNNSFLLSQEKYSDQVMQYEDINLKNIGKSMIPIGNLEKLALDKLRIIQKAIKSKTYTEPEPCIRDLLLVELLNWFNSEFFEWINNLPCKVCGKEDYFDNIGTKIDNGIRVESGYCCGQETNFYRYNDICKLLITRKGRCGEYANCFTFLCRCLNYDARLTIATFDHVWTEVYSIAQKRWLHIDPSDNVIDSPLMYQHGWKREVDYVLSYSHDDVQDVTWRYSSNHKQTLSQRKKCSEHELLKSILEIRAKRQLIVSNARVKYLSKRYLKELIELQKQRNPSEDEKKGRSSGSLSWKKNRGEQNLDNFFIFEPNKFEVISRQLNLRYSCSLDKYERFLNDGQTIKILESCKGWESMQFSAKNMFRKVEKDWKMTYLARQDGSGSGEIVWKFDFSKQNLKVKDVKLKFDYNEFENGKVEILLVNLQGSNVIEGSTGFILKVKLSGGHGDVAYQHAQLFRQKLISDNYPFELTVNLISAIE